MQHVGTEPAAEETPAALVDRFFRGSANGQIAPIASGDLHSETWFAQQIGSWGILLGYGEISVAAEFEFSFNGHANA